MGGAVESREKLGFVWSIVRNITLYMDVKIQLPNGMSTGSHNGQKTKQMFSEMIHNYDQNYGLQKSTKEIRIITS